MDIPPSPSAHFFFFSERRGLLIITTCPLFLFLAEKHPSNNLPLLSAHPFLFPLMSVTDHHLLPLHCCPLGDQHSPALTFVSFHLWMLRFSSLSQPLSSPSTLLILHQSRESSAPRPSAPSLLSGQSRTRVNAQLNQLNFSFFISQGRATSNLLLPRFSLDWDSIQLLADNHQPHHLSRSFTPCLSVRQLQHLSIPLWPKKTTHSHFSSTILAGKLVSFHLLFRPNLDIFISYSPCCCYCTDLAFILSSACIASTVV